MSNITVTHAPSGLVRVHVLRREPVTPHMIRVTFGGPDLKRFEFHGFDQWVRLAIPVHDQDRFDNLPDRFGIGGYLRYRMLPRDTRPVIRNDTVRAFRTDPLELDVDFITHGTEGVAAPWAASVTAGAQAAFIDQGCGWKPVPADWHLIVADESGLPAALGVLRDLPRDATGHAIIELFDTADQQPSPHQRAYNSTGSSVRKERLRGRRPYQPSPSSSSRAGTFTPSLSGSPR